MSRAWPVKDIDPQAPVAENARRILAVRIAELYARVPVVSHPEMTEALHDMRIAAKRLRYTLELFRSEWGVSGQRQIERVKAIQEVLGGLHDHDVLISLIDDELSRLAEEQRVRPRADFTGEDANNLERLAASALRPPPDDPRPGLIALLGREHAARRAAYEAFHALWTRFEHEEMRAELVSLSSMPLSEPCPGGKALV